MLPTKFRFIWRSSFRWEDFLDIDQSETRIASVHLADGFQRRRLKCEKLTDDRQQTTDAKWCQKPTLPLAQWAKKNIKMWIPTCNVYLLIDRDKMSNLLRGPSIDASYQVSVHLAERFQRRRLKCENLTDDGRQVMGPRRKQKWIQYLLLKGKGWIRLL